MPAELRRGDVVRPRQVVVDRTGYRTESRLVVRLRSERARLGRRCSYCHAGIEAGDLYAAGLEIGAPLCLNCVVPEKEPGRP
jgi:hypothetical protein